MESNLGGRDIFARAGNAIGAFEAERKERERERGRERAVMKKRSFVGVVL